MIARLIFAFVLIGHAGVFGQDAYPQDGNEDSESTSTETNMQTYHELVEPESLETTRLYRGENLSVRKFDEARWKEIVGGQDYSEKPMMKFEFNWPSISWAGPVFRMISYAVVISLVVFIIYQIVKNITFDLKVKKEKIQNEDFQEPLEDIEVLDIEVLLDQARREQNFRMAVRLYYLVLLKKLDALGKISWKKDKTNRDYLGELFSRDFYYPEIRNLTLSYEEVWYGDYTLRNDAFEGLKESFESVYQQIHTSKMP